MTAFRFFSDSAYFKNLFRRYACSVKYLSLEDSFFVPDNRYIYLVNDGILKVYVSDADGNQRLLWLLGEGCVIPNFHSGEVVIKKIQVVKNVELLFIEKDKFLTCAAKHPEFFEQFMQQIYGRYEGLIQSFINDSNQFSKIRFYELIYDIARLSEQETIDGILLDQYLSRQDMASLVGTHVTNISKYLLELENANIIKRLKGKRILVCNLEQLEYEIAMLEERRET